MASDASDQKLLDDVARFGWHCVSVASRVEDPIQMTFAYTVGLEVSFDLPELICFGGEGDLLHKLLWGAVDEIRGRPEKPTAGLLLHKVINNYACRLDAFPTFAHADHLGQAIWFARFKHRDPLAIQCLQLVWPDRHGRFPDDPQCVPEVRDLQRPFIAGF